MSVFDRISGIEPNEIDLISLENRGFKLSEIQPNAEFRHGGISYSGPQLERIEYSNNGQARVSIRLRESADGSMYFIRTRISQKMTEKEREDWLLKRHLSLYEKRKVLPAWWTFECLEHPCVKLNVELDAYIHEGQTILNDYISHPEKYEDTLSYLRKN